MMSAEGRAALLAKAAPDTGTEAEVKRRLANAAVVPAGSGAKGVREALATRRGRGPGKKPAKVLLTIRIQRDALERWKATGEGWQTRMAEALEKTR